MRTVISTIGFEVLMIMFTIFQFCKLTFIPAQYLAMNLIDMNLEMTLENQSIILHSKNDIDNICISVCSIR